MFKYRVLPILAVLIFAFCLAGCEDTTNLRKGSHLQTTGNYKEAIKHFNNYLQQYPETKRKPQVEEMTANSYLKWAENEKQIKHWAKGVELMQMVLDKYPNTITAQEVEDLLPEFLLEWSNQQSISGDFLGSLAVLKRLITHFPASGYAKQGRELRKNIGIIAFNSGTDLYVMNADGSKLRKIVESAIDPTISPDGKKLAYIKIRKENDKKGYLYISNIDGRKAKKLLDKPIASEPNFSPDGTNILITKGDAFEKVDLSGRTINVYFGIDAFDTIGSFNPDGNQVVAYLKRPKRNKPTQLCTTENFDEYLELIKIDNDPIRDARWSRDNLRIVYITSKGLHTISPDGENAQDFLLSESMNQMDIRSVDIAPTGYNILFTGKRADDDNFKIYYVDLNKEVKALEIKPGKDGEVPIPSPQRISWGYGYLRY